MQAIRDTLWRLRYRVSQSHFCIGIEVLRKAMPESPVFMPAQTLRDKQLLDTSIKVLAYGKARIAIGDWGIPPAQKQWRRMWRCVQGLQKRYRRLSDTEYAVFQEMYGPIFQSTTPTPPTDGKENQYGSA